MIKCHLCGADTKVLETRDDEEHNSVLRRRQCMAYQDHRFATLEHVEGTPPTALRRRNARLYGALEQALNALELAFEAEVAARDAEDQKTAPTGRQTP